MKLVTVTPTGRKRYLEILVAYLLKNRHIINEHRFWMNTINKDTITYCEKMCKEYPDFFKMTKVFVPPPPQNTEYNSFEIHRFWPTCTEDNTVYIRFDDDVCFMDDNAVEILYKFRIANQHPLLVFGNIVNNAICDHIHQRLGMLPLSLNCIYDCLCAHTWGSPEGAKVIHKAFLDHHKHGRLNNYKFSQWILHDYLRVSINVVSWLGKDMRQMVVTPNEEVNVAVEWPLKFKRPNVICGEALFTHFAFHTQRKEMEPMFLHEYEKMKPSIPILTELQKELLVKQGE